MMAALCGDSGGVTVVGAPCRARIAAGGGLCMAHDPQHRAQKSATAAQGGRVTRLDRALRTTGLDGFFESAKDNLAAALRGDISDQHARSVLNSARTITELADLSMSLLESDRDEDGQLIELVDALHRLREASAGES